MNKFLTSISRAVGEALFQVMAKQGLVLFAFNPAPQGWLAGVTSSSGSHTITLNTLSAATASLPLLSDADANPTTGDIRAITWAFCEALFQKWTALGSAGQPTEMSISKTSSTNPVSGLTTNRYSIGIVTAPTGSAVATEGSGS